MSITFTPKQLRAAGYPSAPSVGQLCRKQAAAIKPSQAGPALKPVKGPNATETGILDMFWLIGGGEWQFEGRSFDVCGGARYTPDWINKTARIAVECKGEYIHSRDSRRRFDEARMLYPDWTWIWARRRTKGRAGKRCVVEIFEGVPDRIGIRGIGMDAADSGVKTKRGGKRHE